MKKAMTTLGLILLTTAAWAGKDSSVRFGLAPELLISPGYHSFLNDAFKDVSGGYGWLGLRATLACKVSDRWTVQPQVTGYFNSVDVNTGSSGRGSTNVNVMGVPALAARYFAYRSDDLEWALNAEVNKPMIESGIDDTEFTGKSIGAGVSTALRFSKRISLELGYKYYPVQAKTTSPFTGGAIKNVDKTYDFGGISLAAHLEF